MDSIMFAIVTHTLNRALLIVCYACTVKLVKFFCNKMFKYLQFVIKQTIRYEKKFLNVCY